MSNLKERAIEIIRNMPDKSSIADIIAELYFRQKVEKGLRELDAGLGIAHKEVKERLSN